MAIGGVLFDIDGVLVTSWQPIAGAAETLRVLADNQIARSYLTNTTTLGSPSTNINAATFGQITALRSGTAPRRIQLGVKFLF